MSHALHYGTSVFEGIRCYDSHKGPVVFRHREHMQRLREDVYKRQGLPMELKSVEDTSWLQLFIKNTAPVSYTHLDVYKRQ